MYQALYVKLRRARSGEVVFDSEAHHCRAGIDVQLVVNRTQMCAQRRSLAWIGRRRMRLPVAAKMAFATAGAIGGSPGSPSPVG